MATLQRLVDDGRLPIAGAVGWVPGIADRITTDDYHEAHAMYDGHEAAAPGI